MPKYVSHDEFVRRAKSAHGDEYDYSVTQYVSMHDKVSILCRKHGIFEQLPQAHLHGQGCPICGRIKQKQTMLDRFGVDNPMKDDRIVAKARQTCLSKYGAEWARSTSAVQEKAVKTNLARRGVAYPLQDAHVRDKVLTTVQGRFGVDNPAQAECVKDKIFATKFENGTFHTSSSEDNLYEILVGMYGSIDVFRQYRSDVYPFSCDFYIASRDLYVELNGTWTHGSHWFNAESVEDMNIVELWHNRGTKYYENAVYVWTVADVRKRECARSHALNYVVFWDYKLRDVDAWLAAGAPDAHDWLEMYSWANND